MRALRSRHSVPGLVVRCRRCRMCFKILTANESLAEAYSEDYVVREGIENYMLSEAARAVFRRVLRGIDLAPRAGRPRLLDMGTGLGGLLEEADKLGFDAQGIDLCEPLVRKARARGLRVDCQTAEQFQPASPFDVVTMLDLIEHEPRPRTLLAAARRLLKPGGELVIYTQNHRAAVVLAAHALHAVGLDFAVNEIFGSNHVSFFDDRTLPVAVQQEGFTVRQMKLFPYDPSRPGQPISLVSAAVVSAIELVGRPFGRLFRLLLYARPKT
ncbi:MAG: methyltransferase domain-containing protein [Verrucomicrobiia bacterium]